ncbi:MAG: hypothetical protein SVK08_00860 [Halobacteriota archaeon]|nr:hypothetical protein [Halobacteriota archaeon]
MEQAFGQAEDLIDFHTRAVPERENRRRPSGLIQTPVLTVESTIIGAFVTWNRLDDPRIAFYEVQLANDNTFSSVETFQTLEAFFAVENVVTTRFVRVRGVRANGDAGLFSEPARVRPTITAPTASAFEFYPGYFNDSLPVLGTSLSFGKNLDQFRELPEFYTILEETFYADRLTGGFSVWGCVSNRLRRFQDSRAVPWDRIRFKLNGIGVMDGYFPLWTNVMDENADFAANRLDSNLDTGELMSFYSLGGYTASFGPYNVTIPTSFAGEGPNDPNRSISLPAPDATFYWTDFNNARLPSRYDQGQFPTPAIEDRFPGSTGLPQHEASSRNIADGEKTDYIYFHDFRFNVPQNRVITGVKAEVSRRQPAFKSSIVSTNLGNTRPDKTSPTGGKICTTASAELSSVCDDVILNYTVIDGGGDPIEVNENIDVLEDVDFGRFIDLSRPVSSFTGISAFANRGPLSSDARGADKFGVPNFKINATTNTRIYARSRMFGDNYTGEVPVAGDINRGLTISIFCNINSLAFVGVPGNHTTRVWNIQGTQGLDVIEVLVTANATSGITLWRARIGSGPFFNVFANIQGIPSGADAALDAFHHICIRWQPSGASPSTGFPGGGDADDLEFFLNGRPAVSWATSLSRTTHSFFSGLKPDAPNSNVEPIAIPEQQNQGNKGIGIGDVWMVEDSDLPGKVAQVAIWDKGLVQTGFKKEIGTLTDNKGRLDYRFNAKDYESSDRLTHYFLFFPDQPDIQDHEVVLVDQDPTSGGARVRTDLENKASIGESWPQLGDFFYTDVKLFGFLPTASSNGIPHDNHTAIGYQAYGGEGDLWGSPEWLSEDVNNFYFGFAIRAINNPTATTATGHAFLDHGRLTLFFAPEEDRSVRATVEASVANQFYFEREVFGALFNVVEIGEKLAELEDC